MNTDPRWTDETAEVVALAIHVADCEYGWEDCRSQNAHGRAVRSILAGLTGAGLLVPPGRRLIPEGSVVREERGYAAPNGGTPLLVGWSSVPPNISRTVITTPWTEVETGSQS